MTTKNKTISLRVSESDLLHLDFIAQRFKNNKSVVIKKLIEEKAKQIQEEELRNAYAEMAKDNNSDEDFVLLFNEINNGN